MRLVIKPELAGFTAASPLATDPSLVEALIDLLHDRGFADVAVVAAADSSALWAENRDLYALSDLLGYRFVTPQGRTYDIVDLADAADETVFPLGSALHGTGISRAWIDADIRIVFAKNRTDEEAGYALGLDTLIGVLPLADKSLHYRRRRHPGDVVAALLAAAPVDFVLIDAVTSAHGAAGRRSPDPVDTNTLIAASDIVLADYIGALKMGLDPVVSPIFARVVQSHPLPTRYTVSGSLAPYAGWQNIPVAVLRSARARAGAVALDRLVEPWLQRLDPALFPLKNPLDARMNATLADFFADTAESPISRWLLVAANLLLGLVGQVIESYRTMFDKDALHRRAVPLGIDTTSIDDAAFDRLVGELIQLEPIAAGAPEMSDGLRWRYVEGAVVFRYGRTLPVDFDTFVRSVDVSRTIQFMNDYLGGVVVPLAHDETGRPFARRNATSICRNRTTSCSTRASRSTCASSRSSNMAPTATGCTGRRFGSENDSATFDDGIATFERSAEGTSICILGRQLFTLPLFWQVFDLDLVPDIKSVLVTHAYRTFFDRTLANFEALVEGRDIRIGRPVDEPATVTAEQIIQLLGRVGEIAAPLLQHMTNLPAPSQAKEYRDTDADGFVHVRPAAQSQQPAAETMSDIDRWIMEIARFVGGLQQAAERDLTQLSRIWMKALVTGAAGLIGAHLVRTLLARGWQVRALMRETSRRDSLAGLPVEIAIADVLNAGRELDLACAGCDMVFHGAAHFAYSGVDAATLHATAVTGTETVLAACARMGVPRVVVTSSSVVFGHRDAATCVDETAGLASGDGEPPYVAAKIAQHRRALELGVALKLDVRLACPTMTLGPTGGRLGPSNGLVVAYLADPFGCTYPGGCNLVAARDVANGHALIAEHGAPGESYLLGSENLTWQQIHTAIAELAGVAPPRLELNQTLTFLAATAEELRASIGRARTAIDARAGGDGGALLLVFAPQGGRPWLCPGSGARRFDRGDLLACRITARLARGQGRHASCCRHLPLPRRCPGRSRFEDIPQPRRSQTSARGTLDHHARSSCRHRTAALRISRRSVSSTGASMRTARCTSSTSGTFAIRCRR